MDRKIGCEYVFAAIFDANCATYVFFELCCRNRALPVYGRATSNAADIQAATAAIQVAQVHGIKHLCIRTDSKFLLESVLLRMPEWKRNRWIRDDGDAGDDLPDFRELNFATHWITVKWEIISAHSGAHSNECAHRLAKKGADKYEIALQTCLSAPEKRKRVHSQDGSN